MRKSLSSSSIRVRTRTGRRSSKPSAVARFYSPASAVSITGLFAFSDTATTTDYFFIEMEYVEGQDLAESCAMLLWEFPSPRASGATLCDVLHHAHTFSAEIEGHQYHGIVHGDIKPRNIRITPDGQVKVLDFGIAKALSLTRKFTTNQFGSSQYSSPERLNTGDVDIASDLWSVGVVLYEIVTGKPYFQGETVAEDRAGDPQLFGSATATGIVARSVSRQFCASPGCGSRARYQSRVRFAADLNAFLEGKPTAAEAADDETPEATRRLTIGRATRYDEAATRRTSAPRRHVVRLLRRSGRVNLSSGGEDASHSAATPDPLLRRPAPLSLLYCLLFQRIQYWRRGAQLAREVDSERLTDMDAAWQRYDALEKTSFLRWLLSAPRNAIQSRLISVAIQ